MSETPPISILRIEGESNRAYDARVRYITMGPGRSIERVGQQLGYKSANPPGHLTRWSSEFGWADSARRYDDAVANYAAQQSAAQHIANIEAHRAEAMVVGAELVAIGRAMVSELTKRSDTLDYRPVDLGAAVKAIMTGLDIKAHALDLPRLLAELGKSSDD